VPPDAVVECGDDTSEAALGSAIAIDRCNPSVSITSSDAGTIHNANCPTAGAHRTIVRTWTANDGCTGDVTSDGQTILVVDTQPPIMQDVPDSVHIQCAADIPALATVTATDVCVTPSVSINVDQVVHSSCPDDLTQTVTYRAEDFCGNFVEKTQTVFVKDTEPPVISGDFSYVEAQCTFPADPLVSGSDNCGSFALDEDSFTRASDQQYGHYDRFITYRAVDACGNVAEQSKHVHLVIETGLSIGASVGSVNAPGSVVLTVSNAGPCTELVGGIVIRFSPFPFSVTTAGDWSCDDNEAGEVRCTNTVVSPSALTVTFGIVQTAVGTASFDVVFEVETTTMLDPDASDNAVVVTVTRP